PVVIVGEASTADGALALFREQEPDAVVLDLNLADGDGCAVLAEIKRARPACVVIVLTNFVIAESRAACLRLGADHFLEKSKEFERVPEVLKQLRGTPASAAKEASSGPVTPPSPQHQQPPVGNSWQIVQALPAAVYTCDLQGRITAFNTAAAKLWGCEPALGKTLWCGSWRILEPDGRPIAPEDCPMAVTIREGRPVQGRELVIERPDGVRAHVLPHPQLIRDAAGVVVGAVNMLVDITGRHRAEAALGMSEEKFAKVVHNSPHPILATRLTDGQIIELNKSFTEFSGWHLAEALGRTTHELGFWTRPSDRELFIQQLHAAGRVENFEAVLRHRSGGERHVLLNAEVVELGGERAILGEILDVTARKQAEAALRDSELRFRSIWEHSVDGMRLLDAEGRIVAVNESYCRLVGMRREELEGQLFPVAYLDPRPAAERLETFRGRFARREIPQREERRMTFRDHRVADLEITHSFLEVPGQPTLILDLFRDVTQRRAADDARRASEEKFLNLFESSPDAIVAATREGRINIVNREAERLFGYSRTELVGQPIESLMPSRLAVGHAAMRGQYTQEPKVRRMGEGRNLLARRKDGTEFPVDISLSPFTTAEGMMVISTIRDITERKRAEEALREKENLLTESQRIAHIGSWLVEHDGRTTWSEETYRIYGVTPETFIPNATSFLQLLHPEDRPAMQRWIADCRAEKQPGDLEFRCVLPDGTVRFLRGRGELRKDAQGRPCMMGTVQDITKRKRAEEALVSAELLYHSLVENLPQNIFRKDRSGRFIFVNQRFCDTVGRPRAEVLGRTDADLFPPELAAKYVADDNRVMESRQPCTVVEEHVPPEGGRLFVEVTKSPLCDPAGNVTGVQGIFWDVTERETAAETLRQSQAGLSTFFRASPAAICINTVESGRLIEVNDRYCEFFGYEREELVGRSVWELNLLADPAKRAGLMERLLVEGTIHDIEDRYRRKSGEVRDVLASLELIDLAGQSEPVLILMFTDITERKRAEAALIEERQLLRTMMDNLPAYIFVKDTAGRYLLSNESHTQLLGAKSEAELLTKTAADFFPPAVAAAYARDDQAMLGTGTPILQREEAYEAEGKRRWYSLTKVPLRDERGKITGLVGIKHDITERKLAEENLARERNLLRTVIDNLPAYVFVKDTRGRYLLVNEPHRQKLGLDTETQMLGKTSFDFFPEEIARGFEADDQTVMQNARAVIGREEPFESEGKRGWYLTTKVPLHDAQGQIAGLVGIALDITERKRAEEVLQQRASELERFNRLSVGREKQMIELKQEINELARQAGRTPPHDLSFLEKRKP
ncbi:MAG: PAS domain S-box protein, partial [Limisphaerales bacterium]